MKRARTPFQCAGVTKANRRCSITVDSKATTESGRLACEPLRRSGRFCLFHAQIFNSLPAQLPPAAMVFYLESLAFWGLTLMGGNLVFSGRGCWLGRDQDFETTGLDVLSAHIVEIGLLDHAGSLVFSTVVCPPELPGEEPTVHGIAPAELSLGPSFAEAFRRMARFLDNSAEMAVREESDSSSEDVGPPALREDPPTIVIAAHNGFKFDLPILMVELVRCGIGLETLERWLFVDTLHVLRAADAELTGGCVKLQCLLSRLRAADGALAAHRACSDCFALRGVCQSIAATLGVSVHQLFAPFCVMLDKRVSLVALSCMM